MGSEFESLAAHPETLVKMRDHAKAPPEHLQFGCPPTLALGRGAAIDQHPALSRKPTDSQSDANAMPPRALVIARAADSPTEFAVTPDRTSSSDKTPISRALYASCARSVLSPLRSDQA